MEDSFAGLRELLRTHMQVLVRELQENEHSQQQQPPYQSGAGVVDADAQTTAAPSSQRKRTQTGSAVTSPGRENLEEGAAPLTSADQATLRTVSGTNMAVSKALVIYTGIPELGNTAPDVVLKEAQFLRASPLAGEVRGGHSLAVETSEPVFLESLASSDAQQMQEELAPQATMVPLSLPTQRTELGPCEWCGGSEWQQREADGRWLCRCYFALLAQRAA